jgi:hypothetical protein
MGACNIPAPCSWQHQQRRLLGAAVNWPMVLWVVSMDLTHYKAVAESLVYHILNKSAISGPGVKRCSCSSSS